MSLKKEYDVIVIGAGPSGVSAAIKCSKKSLKVLIIDSNENSGGQIYRAPPKSYVKKKEKSLKENLIQIKFSEELKKNNIDTAYNHTVWQVSPGYKIDAFSEEGTIQWKTKNLIVATGTYEKIIPFEGWTTPGVIGLAACTVMLKSHQTLPGERIILAGNGPLLILVAYYVVKFGGKIEAIIDTSKKSHWLKSIFSLVLSPQNFIQGITWMLKIIFSRIPIYSNSMVTKVTNEKNGISVEIKNIENKKLKKISTEVLAVGHGLTPSTDITRLLRVDHVYNELKGGWIAKIDKYFRSSAKGLYITGDGAGISGAVAAHDKGKLTAYAILFDENIIDEKEFKQETIQILRKLNRYEIFAKGIANLNSTPKELINNIDENTILCRCEDITKKEIIHAIKKGAKNLNQIKSWTRFGMGPCQGRTCQYSVARVAADELDCKIEELGYLTGRSPIRPFPLDKAIGDFDYDEITKVEAAPL
jgi:thioredoxin reductase/bacterioferritin-associated ferredoxin